MHKAITSYRVQNFASGTSGYLDFTAQLYSAISLTQQLQYYREYQSKVTGIVGQDKALALVSGAIHLLSAGSSDYIQNYYISPLVYGTYTPDRFSDLLIQNFNSFVENLYTMGARKIGMTSVPPLGWLLAAITLFGGGDSNCVELLNNDAMSFNKKVSNATEALKSRHSDLKIVIFDIYNPLLDQINNLANTGFFEARKACCGIGTTETSFLCDTRAPETCSNAIGYVFWDSFHPTEAANKVLSDALLIQGIDLIS